MDGGTDYSLIGHSTRVALLAALRRQRAELDARETCLLAVLAAEPLPGIDGDPATDKEWVREDVACALRIPPATAGGRLHTATELATRLPATLASMRRGEIGLPYAQRLVDAVCFLPDEAATEVEKQVLGRAAGQTVAQFAASVRRAVLAADPRAADEQHRDALTERRVMFTPLDNGMSELWALLPADTAAALQTRIQQLADGWKHLDERTADQRRADALTALTLGQPGSGTGPAVNVTVALSTLLGLDQQPGELDGHGPIPPALARAIAADPTGTWRRLVTDTHGQLLDYGRRTYRPPANLDRHIRARDHTCTFIGCRRAAQRCELDHITDWQDGGTTSAANLQTLCPRHHHLKHDTRWTVRRRPDGTTRWRAPTGRVYERPPPDDLPRDTTASKMTTADQDDAPPF